MNWKGDKYKELKWMIFDLIKTNLTVEDSEKITVKKVSNSIDEMFEKLLDHSDYKGK